MLAGGTLAVAGGAVDGGQDGDASGGTAPGGVIALTGHALASFTDGVADQTFSISGAATISFADVAGLNGVTIAGFDDQSKILLPSFAAGQAALDRLTFTDLPANTAPLLIPTLSGAELLLEPAAPCFARGTCLLTQAGYVPVEAIAPGDMLVTIAGDVKPVRWVGHRAIDIAAHARPEAVRPVRILPGAFGPGQPARHLRLSPDHALLLGGRLVPVKLLVNGATVRRGTALPGRHILSCGVGTSRHSARGKSGRGILSRYRQSQYVRNVSRHTAEKPGIRPRAAMGLARLRGFMPERPNSARHPPEPARPRAGTGLPAAHADGCIALVRQHQVPAKAGPRRARYSAWRRCIRSVCLSAPSASYRRKSPVETPMRMITGCSASPSKNCAWASKPCRFANVAVSGFHPRDAGDEADWTDGNGEIEIPRHVSTVSLKLAALPQGWAAPPGAVALDI